MQGVEALAQSSSSLNCGSYLFSVLYEENRTPDCGSDLLKMAEVESGKCFNS